MLLVVGRKSDQISPHTCIHFKFLCFWRSVDLEEKSNQLCDHIDIPKNEQAKETIALGSTKIPTLSISKNKMTHL